MSLNEALGEYLPSERWSARALVAGIVSRDEMRREGNVAIEHRH